MIVFITPLTHWLSIHHPHPPIKLLFITIHHLHSGWLGSIRISQQSNWTSLCGWFERNWFSWSNPESGLSGWFARELFSGWGKYLKAVKKTVGLISVFIVHTHASVDIYSHARTLYDETHFFYHHILSFYLLDLSEWSSHSLTHLFSPSFLPLFSSYFYYVILGYRTGI